MTLGKQGHPPPWPREPQEAAAWQIRHIGKLLRQAEVRHLSGSVRRGDGCGRYP